MSLLHEPKLTVIASTLRGCQAFSGLPPADISAIAAFTVIKPLEKGQYLFQQGDPSDGFYVVQKGAVNIHRVNAIGKEQVLHVFRAGESFAEGSLATDAGYPADARAVEPSTVLLVRKPEFVALLKRQPELALRMLASMSLHLRVLVAQIEDLTLKDVETRLANWLVKRCPDPQADEPCEIRLDLTKRLLASELGTVSETLSRTLAKFRDQKLIAVRGKSITVQSPSRLLALLRHHLGEAQDED